MAESITESITAGSAHISPHSHSAVASIYSEPVMAPLRIQFTNEDGRYITIDEQVQASKEELERNKQTVGFLQVELHMLQDDIIRLRAEYDTLISELRQYNAIPGGSNGIL